MYFKVTVAKDGAIREVEQTANRFAEDGSHVFYVEADSKKEAAERAKKLWHKHYDSLKRERSVKAGVCFRDGAKLGRGVLHCDACLEEQKMRRERVAKIRKTLELGPRDPIPMELQLEKGARRTIDTLGIGGQKLNARLSHLLEFQFAIAREGLSGIKGWVEQEIKMARKALREAPGKVIPIGRVRSTRGVAAVPRKRAVASGR